MMMLILTIDRGLLGILQRLAKYTFCYFTMTIALTHKWAVRFILCWRFGRDLYILHRRVVHLYYIHIHYSIYNAEDDRLIDAKFYHTEYPLKKLFDKIGLYEMNCLLLR